MVRWQKHVEQLCNENQLDALFILSLFRQSTSICFGHICGPSSGGILYIYNNWYVLCFSVNCLLAGQQTVNCKAGRIIRVSTKNSSDTIGNRTRDLTAYSAVPQPTAPPRAPTNQESAVYFPSFLGTLVNYRS